MDRGSRGNAGDNALLTAKPSCRRKGLVIASAKTVAIKGPGDVTESTLTYRFVAVR